MFLLLCGKASSYRIAGGWIVLWAPKQGILTQLSVESKIFIISLRSKTDNNVTFRAALFYWWILTFSIVIEKQCQLLSKWIGTTELEIAKILALNPCVQISLVWVHILWKNNFYADWFLISWIRLQKTLFSDQEMWSQEMPKRTRRKIELVHLQMCM